MPVDTNAFPCSTTDARERGAKRFCSYFHPSAANKKRILDMGGMEILLTLSRSDEERTRQQASKALANIDLDSDISRGK